MATSNKYHSENRDLIFNLSKGFDTPFTAKDIQDSLSKNNKHISTSTIYRILDEFVGDNILTISMGDNNTATYRYLEPCKNTNHCNLECIVCHKTFHVDCSKIKTLSKHLSKEHNFTVVNSNLIISGICSECINHE